MTQTVLVKKGEYRNSPVENVTFTLVKDFHHGKKGNYITVENNNHFAVDIAHVKIKVEDRSDIEIYGQKDNIPNINPETDDEAMDRIATRFEILDEMAEACVRGDLRGMIVSGPPGVGKSYGVERQLEKSSLFDRIAGNKIRYNTVKGAMTSLGLYIQLYNYSDPANVLIFDDCDSIFMDDLSLNILKAALDSGKKRKICWNSDSRLLRDENIPNSFEYRGTAIFITNLKFHHIRSKRLQDHLEALQSRCHFLDLTIDTERDKLLRIKQVHRDTPNGLFADYGFSRGVDTEIFAYMEENSKKLREISIRMALKIADLIKINPNKWKTLAESTCMIRLSNM